MINHALILHLLREDLLMADHVAACVATRLKNRLWPRFMVRAAATPMANEPDCVGLHLTWRPTSSWWTSARSITTLRVDRTAFEAVQRSAPFSLIWNLSRDIQRQLPRSAAPLTDRQCMLNFSGYYYHRIWSLIWRDITTPLLYHWDTVRAAVPANIARTSEWKS